MVSHAITANDEHPAWPIVLGYNGVDAAEWPPIPAGATVRCITVKRNAQGATAKVSPESGPGSVQIDDAAARRVIKTFSEGEFTNADVGDHDVQWQITYADGTSETWPAPGEFDKLTIGRDLDEGAVA